MSPLHEYEINLQRPERADRLIREGVIPDWIGQTPCYVVASSSRGRGPLGFLLVQVTGAGVSTEFVVTWPDPIGNRARNAD